jgi:hypothetical protein
MNAQSTPELHFVHLGTSVLNPGDTAHPSMGQTLWGNPSSKAVAGVAWDWMELQQGVFAIADPLGLVTNLRLLGPKGEALSSLQVALYLNELVRTLPWQSEVSRALQSEHLLQSH